jgi:hypothetical protein
MANDTPLLAVLIDADNTSYKHARAIFDEIASFGEASVRRIYGDFSSSHMKGWSGVQAEFGIVPHHQPANTVGKNASDIALVIDAMDLMHSGRFDGFVLCQFRQRFHPAGQPHPRTGARRLRHRPAEDAGRVPQGLQAVHLRGEHPGVR